MLLHAGCAMLYLLLALAVPFSTRPDRTSYALAASCLITALWAGAVAYAAAGNPLAPVPLARILDLARSACWYGFVLHLYDRSVPNGSRLGRLLSFLGLLTILAAAIAMPGLSVGGLPAGIAVQLGLAVCTVLLIENLYRNAAEDLRWHIILPCVAIGGLGVYDIALYSDAALFRRLSPALLDGRAAVMALLVPLLAIAARRNRRRWAVKIRVSHRAVFYSASLVMTGVFLLGLAAAGEALRQFGADWADRWGGEWGVVLEVSLICGGLLAAAVLLTSGSARSSLRHLVVNNFLSHRYDYRLEWLRCISTLSQTDGYVALHTRVIKAVAQVVDSPAGLVFLREPEGSVFRWAGSWNLPAASLLMPEHPLVPLFRGGGWVVQAPDGMPWIDALPELWLAVPLSHAGRLMGFTLLARPRAPFALDGEVFALLRIVGQEVASYITERRAAEALLQTRHLREYGQRFTFVAHDIKNIASQLSLLLANAEHHISNPAFQQDMLGTIGGSVKKITALLARLKAPAETPAPSVLGVGDCLAAFVEAGNPARRSRIQLEAGAEVEAIRIVMPASAFEAVVTHLLDNAFEASADDAPVQIAYRHEQHRVLIDIIDQGAGMTAEFIREHLFQPFSTSKSDGFGIGVYQARELLRQAGGDLIVTSTPGAGTTMRLSLPPAPALAPVLQLVR